MIDNEFVDMRDGYPLSDYGAFHDDPPRLYLVHTAHSGIPRINEELWPEHMIFVSIQNPEPKVPRLIINTIVDPQEVVWDHKDTATVVHDLMGQNNIVHNIVATTPPRPPGLMVRYIGDKLPDDTISLELKYPYPIFFAPITNPSTHIQSLLHKVIGIINLNVPGVLLKIQPDEASITGVPATAIRRLKFEEKFLKISSTIGCRADGGTICYTPYITEDQLLHYMYHALGWNHEVGVEYGDCHYVLKGIVDQNGGARGEYVTFDTHKLSKTIHDQAQADLRSKYPLPPSRSSTSSNAPASDNSCIIL